MKKTYSTPLITEEQLTTATVILGTSSNVRLKQTTTPTDIWEAR